MRKRTNKLLAVLLTGAMAMSMGACGNGGASTDNTQKKGSDDQVTIKITWWGGDARHEATQKVLDLYTESHPNVKFEAIPAGWDGYFEKLSTQAASGSMPDIVQMDYLYISTYAKNNSLADLSEYVDSGVIDTSTIDKNIMKTGDSNGKTVGIPLSTTALAVTYNPTVIEQAGAEVPSDDWTWDDYITLNEKVAKSTGKPSALAATAGIFGDVNIFNYWVRSQGESLFNEDGTALGYDDDKITSDFFDMWKKMADDNVAPDADEQTQIASLGKEGLPIVTDEAATDIEWNAFPTTVSSANPNLKLAVMPNAKDSGLWLKPGMFFSVSETSKVKEECAKFINWFVNSNEANEILLGERGTPVSSDVRDNLIERDKLSEQQKEAFEYTDKVSAVVCETPAADPSGIAEVNEAFASAGNSVLYGQLTSKEAAKDIVGLAYPGGGIGGVNTNEHIISLIRKNSKIKYARTTICNGSFDTQDNLLEFHPTAYHLNFDEIMELGEKFIKLKTEEKKIFYVWGHSYELDYHDSWSDIERFCKMMSGYDDICYATNKEALLG